MWTYLQNFNKICKDKILKLFQETNASLTQMLTLSCLELNQGVLKLQLPYTNLMGEWKACLFLQSRFKKKDSYQFKTQTILTNVVWIEISKCFLGWFLSGFFYNLYVKFKVVLNFK